MIGVEIKTSASSHETNISCAFSQFFDNNVMQRQQFRSEHPTLDLIIGSEIIIIVASSYSLSPPPKTIKGRFSFSPYFLCGGEQGEFTFVLGAIERRNLK